MTLETFKEEILPLKNKLYRFALRLLDDTTEAQDVVQEVFIKLWDRRTSLDECRSVEAFAMVTTRNQCLDLLKSKGYKMKQRLVNNFDSGFNSPEQEFEMKETVIIVKQFINSLPEQQKMVIHLRDVEGYEFEEISEITGLNVNAIRVNLSRARKKVREAFEKNNSYEYTSN